MTSIVAVDLDNTLYDFDTPARDAFLKLGIERGNKGFFKGAYNAWGEWRSMTDSCGDDIQEEVIQMVHEPESILEQHPFKGSQQVLHELEEQGHTLLFISNREPERHRPTAVWLEDHGFPPGELICTRESKLPLIAHCQYLIDDRPKTLVQFVFEYDWKNKYGSQNGAMQRKAFSLAYPYNQALTDVPGMYFAPTWGGIQYYLAKEGVLDG